MPDTFTTTLHLTKPATSSLAWDPKLNGNFDIIDTMGPRIAALEGLFGGAVPGYIRLAPGSVWADLVAAYNNAHDGDTIVLANETIEQTASIWWKKNVNLVGGGPLSKIIARGNLSIFGSSLQFAVASEASAPTSNVTFANFIIEHDRVTGGAGMRMNPISIGDSATNIYMKNLTILGATANAISIAKSNPQFSSKIYILGCTITEVYEAGIIVDSGNIADIYIIGNTILTSASSPQGGVSRPQGIFLGNEQMDFGLMKNVHCIGNLIDFRPLGSGNGQSLGITLSTGNQTGSPGLDIWRYDQIRLCNNTIYHASTGIRLQGLKTHAWTKFLHCAYELSEATSTVRRDSTANVLHLTDHGTVTQAVGHLTGQFSAEFNGTNQWLSHADSALYEPAVGEGAVVGYLSQMLWVYLGAKPSNQMVACGKWNTTGNQRGWRLLWDNTTDRFIFEVSNDGTAVTAVTASTFGAPSLNTWYFLTIVYNPVDDLMSISVNAGTPNTTAQSTGVNNSTADFTIGAEHGGANFWNGRIAQVREWVAPWYGTGSFDSGDGPTNVYRGGTGFTYKQLYDAAGPVHITVIGNMVEDCTDECIDTGSIADGNFLDVSDNECHILPGQSGVSANADMTTSKPNRILSTPWPLVFGPE